MSWDAFSMWIAELPMCVLLLGTTHACPHLLGPVILRNSTGKNLSNQQTRFIPPESELFPFNEDLTVQVMPPQIIFFFFFLERAVIENKLQVNICQETC